MYALQEEGSFSHTLAPQFVKYLRNLYFSNSGAKVVIMWRYSSGAMFSGAKVELVKNVIFGVKCICGILRLWCKPPKTNLMWIKIL